MSKGDRTKRAPQKMGDLITQLMARRGYGQTMSSDEFRQAWEKVAGPLAKDSLTGNLRRGVLDVFVRNSAILQEVTFQKRTLLKQLQDILPKHGINDLRFKVGPID